MAKKQTTQEGKGMQEAIVALRKEIQKLSMDNAKRQLKQTSLLRTKKDELARLLTALSMKPAELVKEETK